MSETVAGSVLPEVSFHFSVAGGDAGGWSVMHLHLAEALSKPYEATLLVAHTLPAPEASALHAQRVGVDLSRGSGGGRGLRGRVRRVESLGATGAFAFARLTVVPSLWALSLRQSSRIWQDVPVATIVRDVLRDAGIYQGDGAFEVAPSVQSLPAREYTVQYRESDLAFVSRLLEEEGIPYYFKHDGVEESFVLAGRDQVWAKVPTIHGGAVPVLDGGAATSSVESVSWITAATQTASTGALLRDFDFTRPDAKLDMTRASPGESGASVVYDYPARFTLGPYDSASHVYGRHAGDAWARVRGEELRSEVDTLIGRSNVTGLTPGMSLALSGHADPSHDGPQLVIAAEHHALAIGDISDDLWRSERFQSLLRRVGAESDLASTESRARTRYYNRFTTVPASVSWRPPRTTARPVLAGPQTAWVVAENGSNDEICTDAHGRILVLFHWERPEQRNSAQASKNASCWVRVAQSWSGAAWGAMVIPRVGMEVVVNFLEGDPDRPLVTGCVYNGKNRPPYELPAHKTRSTFMTLSSPGGDGYNELRFEDQKHHEQVWLHAERDHDVVVKHDATMTVGHDRTHTIEHDEQLTVFNDRAASVRRNDSLEVEGYRSVTVHGLPGLSTQVAAVYRLNADAGIVLTCGSSTFEMLPDKITVSSKTVNVIGSKLINIHGKLVKINCDAPKGPQKVGVLAPTATRALALSGKPGSVLDKVKMVTSPSALSAAASTGMDSLANTAGAPATVASRLTAQARSVVDDMASSIERGHAPDWGHLSEQAIGAAVGAGVDAVFGPILRSSAVQGSRVLHGLMSEARSFSEDAATWGVLHAAGLNEAMAGDPFWQAMKARHGEAWRAYLSDQAEVAAKDYLDGVMRRHGASPLVQRGVDVMIGAARSGVGAGMTALLGAG